MNDPKVLPQYVKDLLAAGYGKLLTPEIVASDHPHPAGVDGPNYGSFFLSFREMEEMGEEKRIQFGVESTYQLALAQHKAK